MGAAAGQNARRPPDRAANRHSPAESVPRPPARPENRLTFGAPFC